MNNNDNDPELDQPPQEDEEELVSKSQRKRDMHALQDLGRQLLEADRKLLEKCALPDTLSRAIEEYKRLPNAHGARKRQMQFIGKLMRDVDTDAIEAVLQQSRRSAAVDNRRFQRLEVLRDALLAGDSESLDQLIQEHPQMDIQHLRQLIRQSQKEQQAGKPPAASRKLFRYLREVTLKE